MATVYLVTEGEYSDYHVIAAFSTREKALEFCAGDESMIQEFPLDDPAKNSFRKYWRVTIDMKDGTLSYPSTGIEQATPSLRGKVAWVYSSPQANVTSFVSAEHANKLAAEARQHWLRSGSHRFWHAFPFERLPSEARSMLENAESSIIESVC